MRINMKKYKIALILLLIVPFLVSAVTIENPLSYNTFDDLVAGLISFVTIVGIAVAPILFIIAGFYYLTAGGNPANVEKAKSIFTWTVIGLAIILLASSISYLVKNILGVDAATIFMNNIL